MRPVTAARALGGDDNALRSLPTPFLRRAPGGLVPLVSRLRERLPVEFERNLATASLHRAKQAPRLCADGGFLGGGRFFQRRRRFFNLSRLEAVGGVVVSEPVVSSSVVLVVNSTFVVFGSTSTSTSASLSSKSLIISSSHESSFGGRGG
eukprot:CAMPEP_0180372552 /NCGR_PEP_ID=MMETSP0989-20121125/20628_1 /TAXON_ID=697907 /ORGANISM="non described non described, Strain CCMP2293" /LENGTH=149 /DNA_ID=CAMNT_0022369079 /DNA_START=863 /DNA_END=1308 /DNA_ORIENTATION=+